MQSFKSRAALFGTAWSIGVGALFVGAPMASATEVVAVPPPDQGTLYLETAAYSKLQFRWDRVGTATDIIQKIVDKSWTTKKFSDICSLVLSPATTATPAVGLVTLPTSAGFIGDHIGIKSSSGYCSEISGAESLTIGLGGVLAGYQVYYTELNLELKKNAVVRIDTAFGAATQTFIIRTPSSAAVTTPPGATEVLCQFETGTQETDICRWKSDAFWSSATIKALAGTISIEGGTGGGSGTFSKFAITQLNETLACAPGSVPVAGITAIDLPTGAIAIGTRLENTVEGQTCKPIPVALTWSDDANPVLQFFKADLGQAVATTFAVTWPNADVPAGGLSAIGLSLQQFVPGVDVPIDLCVGTPSYVPDPLFPAVDHLDEFLLTGISGITAAEDQANGVGDPAGIQYGCTYDRRIIYPEAGKYGLKEFIYLEGDWTAKRN